ENLSIKAAAITPASDTELLFLSDSSTVSNCDFDTNVGGIALWGSNRVTIDGCTFRAISHNNTFNNQIILATGLSSMASITITNKVLAHYGGGGTTSHSVVLECSTATAALTNLTFQNNVVWTTTLAPNLNTSAIGVRLGRCPGAQVKYNSLKYNNTG